MGALKREEEIRRLKEAAAQRGQIEPVEKIIEKIGAANENEDTALQRQMEIVKDNNAKVAQVLVSKDQNEIASATQTLDETSNYIETINEKYRAVRAERDTLAVLNEQLSKANYDLIRKRDVRPEPQAEKNKNPQNYLGSEPNNMDELLKEIG